MARRKPGIANLSYPTPPGGFRTFLILWSTQSISVFGTALTFFAVTFWLTLGLYPRPEQKPELAFAISALSLAFSLPTVFAAPLAGAWADRHDRKSTMMMMNMANCGISFVLAGLLVAHALQLWMVIILTVLYSFFGAFHSSAFDTSYAMIVPEKQLPRANGMMQTMWALSGILAPPVAAFIFSLPAFARQGWLPIDSAMAQLRDGTPIAVGLDAITFAVAGVTLLFLNIPSPRRADLAEGGRRRKSTWADVKEGAVYIWHRSPLLWLLGTFTVANFVSSPLGVFEPLITRFNLANDWSSRGFTFETAFALLSSAGGLGGVVGGAFVSAWGGLKARRVYGVVVPLIILGAAQVVFGISTLLYLSAAMVFALSAMVPIMNSHSQAIWQIQTPRELQGRVFAVRRLIAQFTWPLSTAVAGLTGGIFNPGLVMGLLGGFLVAFCAAQLFNPHLLRVEDKAWLDRMAASAEAKR